MLPYQPSSQVDNFVTTKTTTAASGAFPYPADLENLSDDDEEAGDLPAEEEDQDGGTEAPVRRIQVQEHSSADGAPVPDAAAAAAAAGQTASSWQPSQTDNINRHLLTALFSRMGSVAGAESRAPQPEDRLQRMLRRAAEREALAARDSEDEFATDSDAEAEAPVSAPASAVQLNANQSQDGARQSDEAAAAHEVNLNSRLPSSFTALSSEQVGDER